MYLGSDSMFQWTFIYQYSFSRLGSGATREGCAVLGLRAYYWPQNLATMSAASSLNGWNHYNRALWNVRGTFVDTLASPFEYTDNKIFGEIVVQLRKWWCRFDDLDSAKFRVG
jgi:hypothetical protein